MGNPPLRLSEIFSWSTWKFLLRHFGSLQCEALHSETSHFTPEPDFLCMANNEPPFPWMAMHWRREPGRHYRFAFTAVSNGHGKQLTAWRRLEDKCQASLLPKIKSTEVSTAGKRGGQRTEKVHVITK